MAGNVTRFDPFNDVVRLSPLRRMEELIREFSMAPMVRGLESDRQILVDVTETDQAYLVKADLPGLKKDDIKIAVDGNVVSISATMQEEKQETTEDTICTERYSGALYRRFSLPKEVDDSKTEAKYQDGVLNLSLPKKASSAKKQITIQ